jgi:ATPase subunit of ABC transporter with duplicated ATPase domains
MAEFIYTMKKVRKAHGDKVILDDVYIQFYPGAKIGVVGPNGAGKSSVLKIMAGLDQPNNGEAFLSPGYTVGILQQEPPLNEDKTVLGNVQEGVGEIHQKLIRFNEIAEKMATDYSDELMDGPPPGGPRPRGRLGPGLAARAGHGRSALPAAGRGRQGALRW